VAGGRAARAAVAAWVHRDHAEVVRQVWDLVLPQATVDDRLARGTQEEIRAVARRLPEDLRVRSLDEHSLSLGLRRLPSKLVEDERGAPAHRPRLVTADDLHARARQRGRVRVATDALDDLVAEGLERAGDAAGDDDDLRIDAVHDHGEERRQRYATLIDDRACEGIGEPRRLEDELGGDAARTAAGHRHELRA